MIDIDSSGLDGAVPAIIGINVAGDDLESPFPLPVGISKDFLAHHRVCPIGISQDGCVTVGVTQGSLMAGLDDLSLSYARPVVARTVSESEFAELIRRAADAAGARDGVEVASAHEEDDAEFTRDIRERANEPPVVRYVSHLLREAYLAGASDIHLEAGRTGLLARYRIDGVLMPGSEPPIKADRAIVSRLKLLAELDIAERRRPQDGRIRVRLDNRELDLRVSTVPTVFGESVVLRLLERGGSAVALDALGLAPSAQDHIRQIARRPAGMFLVTGPTGSGKSTTLHSMLGLRSHVSEKVITIEDPVEYTIDGIVQVPVHLPTGVTFASVLRSVLRQDPDVILVGEMRDSETAELAVQAALTGHMVFSTLHTTDALGAIPRLLDLGIAPFLLAATLEAMLAQRLVRVVCSACRERYVPSDAAQRLWEQSQREPMEFTRGRGCAECRGSGFRGRTGIFELLAIDSDFREAIAAGSARREFERLAESTGLRSMRLDGFDKVLQGHTTIEEVLRVTRG